MSTPNNPDNLSVIVTSTETWSYILTAEEADKYLKLANEDDDKAEEYAEELAAANAAFQQANVGSTIEHDIDVS